MRHSREPVLSSAVLSQHIFGTEACWGVRMRRPQEFVRGSRVCLWAGVGKRRGRVRVKGERGVCAGVCGGVRGVGVTHLCVCCRSYFRLNLRS